MKKLIGLVVWLFLFAFAFTAVSAVAGQLPDTGQTKCYDNSSEIPCPQPGQPFYGQDAQYTRARSYTKLDQNGSPLPDSALEWYQVKDNVTGLIWEVKNARDGVKDYNNPHDADNTYTWYDSNPATNGGDAGTPGDGTDTEDFINALNAVNYGGHTDWRLPTVRELACLTDSGSNNPAIDTVYFPRTVSSDYWSSTTNASSTGNAWLVCFYHGLVYGSNKTNSCYVRAVRSGQ